MIAIDTNVLVRYLVRDDPDQTARAKRFLETELSRERPGYLTLVALAELFWVLRRVYRLPHTDTVDIIERVLAAPQLLVEQAALVDAALASAHSDLGDLLIQAVGRANGCSRTITFDEAFARLPDAELLA